MKTRTRPTLRRNGRYMLNRRIEHRLYRRDVVNMLAHTNYSAEELSTKDWDWLTNEIGRTLFERGRTSMDYPDNADDESRAAADAFLTRLGWEATEADRDDPWPYAEGT